MLLGGNLQLESIKLLWASALPNYTVACLLLWASTHLMTCQCLLMGYFVSKTQISYGGSMPIEVL